MMRRFRRGPTEALGVAVTEWRSESHNTEPPCAMISEPFFSRAILSRVLEALCAPGGLAREVPVYELGGTCHRRSAPPRKAPRARHYSFHIPAINQMFEIAAAKAIAVQTHSPALVFDFRVFAALLNGLVAGFGMARGQRNWLSISVYASVVAAPLYLMTEMEHPPRALFVSVRQTSR